MRARKLRYNEAHREEAKAYSRRYREEHPGDSVAYTRAWRDAHPGAFHEYYLQNKDRYRAHTQARRAALRGAEGSHDAKDISAQYARQRGKCFWRDVNEECAVSLRDGYHIDHVVPLSKGGSNGPENLVLACPTCNLQKNAKHPMDWAGQLF